MKKRLIRKIIGGISFTSVLFVFQACYGTPQDFGLDVKLSGTVKSATTGLPIQAIRVSVSEELQYAVTDEDGKYSFYVPSSNALSVSFQDIDSVENGVYLSSDTIIKADKESFQLDISLNTKK